MLNITAHLWGHVYYGLYEFHNSMIPSFPELRDTRSELHQSHTEVKMHTFTWTV